MPSRYRDISLVFGIHPIKKDIGTLVDIAAVKRSVINLVMTKHFSRPFHAEIGCDVNKMLFENATPIIAMNIQRSVEDVLRNFEPRVKVASVTSTLDPDMNGYNLTIAFYVLNFPSLVTVDMFLERVR